MEETLIELDYFLGKDDLIIKISRETFEKICFDLFLKIEKTIHSVIDEGGINYDNIGEVILVGGASKMISIKKLLEKYFNPQKIKLNSNSEDSVAYGATIDLIQSNLKEIVAYNLGVETFNDEMNIIIKKFSRIPSSKSKNFQITLTEEKPNIAINIYEGNNKLVRNNKFLGQIIFDEINKFGEISHNIKFSVDMNYTLTVNVKIDSLDIEKKLEIKNITHAVCNKVEKKIKIINNRPKFDIGHILMGGINRFPTEEEILCEKIRKQEDMVKTYMIFIDEVQSYERIYSSTKELFYLYIDLFKLKQNKKENISFYIIKIKEFMKNLTRIIDYINIKDILAIFEELKHIGYIQEFYEIFIDYIELLNNEALTKKINSNYNNCKIYIENVLYDTNKYILDSDLEAMNESLKNKFLEQKKICKEELKKINFFEYLTYLIEKRIKFDKLNFENTGFINIKKKFENFGKNEDKLSREEILEVLDIYRYMANSYDDAKYSIEELYCLSNIIYINGKIFRRGLKKLNKVIKRFEIILKNLENVKLDWIESTKKIIKEIKDKKI